MSPKKRVFRGTLKRQISFYLCAIFLLLSPANGVDVVSPLPFSGDIQLEPEQAAEVSKLQAGTELRLVPPKNAPEITCIKRRGTLVIGMLNRDVPPFFMQDKEGNMIGIDVEIASAMAKELGVKVAFNRSAKTFDDVVDMVVNRQADFGISKLNQTLKRAEQVKFSKPYVSLNKAVLVNRLALEKARTMPGESLENVINRPSSQIGVEEGSPYVNYAKRLFPKASIIEFSSWEDEIAPKVLSGEILAAFRDEWEVRKSMYLAPQSYIKNLAIIIREEPDSLMIIVPWNSSQLLSWVNSFLDLKKIQFTSSDVLNRFRQVHDNDTSANNMEIAQ